MVYKEKLMIYCSMRCPECGKQNAVPLPELAVGHAVHCPQCGAGLYLNHTRPDADAESEWRLESMDPFVEERRSV